MSKQLVSDFDIRWNKSPAFTLVEFLVVIAVLFLLFIIMVPISSHAVESFRSAKCSANLRSVAQAGLSWAADNGERMPCRSYWSVYLRGSSSDPFSIFPYLGIPWGDSNEDSVLTCPSYRARYEPLGSGVVSSWHRTYGINMYTVGYIDRSTEHEDLRYSYQILSAVPDLNRVAFFFDGPVTPNGGGVGSYNPRFQYPEFRRVGEENIGIKGTDYIHSGAINVVFLDGRVERITPERVESEGLSAKEHPLWGRKP